MEVFSSQGDGTLTVIKESSPTSFAVEQTVFTPQRAKTITLDTKTGYLFLITAEYGPTPVPPSPPTGTAPGGMRGMRPPMIAHSFQILVVGKDASAN
jgi:hypothetical protein